MTQEQKELLLLKDLCGRLPYGIKCSFDNKVFSIDYISAIYEEIKLDSRDDYTLIISDVKPYLFPLSSMNLDQRIEYSKTLVIFDESHCSQTHETYDWLNKNHFDYRGLLEKGLAIDATNLNIY